MNVDCVTCGSKLRTRRDILRSSFDNDVSRNILFEDIMKARDIKYQLLITIDTVVMNGDNFDQQVDEVQTRIKEQLAGHRTPKRLADHVDITTFRVVSESTREI